MRVNIADVGIPGVSRWVLEISFPFVVRSGIRIVGGRCAYQRFEGAVQGNNGSAMKEGCRHEVKIEAEGWKSGAGRSRGCGDALAVEKGAMKMESEMPAVSTIILAPPRSGAEDHSHNIECTDNQFRGSIKTRAALVVSGSSKESVRQSNHDTGEEGAMGIELDMSAVITIIILVQRHSREEGDIHLINSTDSPKSVYFEHSYAVLRVSR
jgi:hypothetical protein